MSDGRTFVNVGRFWERQTKNDAPMLAGRVTIDGVEYQMNLFRNKFKLSSADTKAADWFAQIVTYEPEPEGEHPF